MKAVLLYPASRDALLMLGMAALALTAKQILDGLLEITSGLKSILSVPVFSIAGILGVVMLALLPSFFMSITRRAAAGKPGIPDWPGVHDLFALAGAALKLVAVVVWSFLPLLLYMAAVNDGRLHPSADRRQPVPADGDAAAHHDGQAVAGVAALQCDRSDRDNIPQLLAVVAADVAGASVAARQCTAVSDPCHRANHRHIRRAVSAVLRNGGVGPILPA
jgi:hypothetical protein